MDTKITYCAAIDAYHNDKKGMVGSVYATKHFDIFKQVCNEMKFHHEFMFMLFLHVQALFDPENFTYCYDYVTEIFLNQLTKEESILCIISNIISMDDICLQYSIPYMSDIVVNKIGTDKIKGETTRANIITILKIFDKTTFDALNKSIQEHSIIFSGKKEDFELIERWLDMIRNILKNPLFDLINI